MTVHTRMPRELMAEEYQLQPERDSWQELPGALTASARRLDECVVRHAHCVLLLALFVVSRLPDVAAPSPQSHSERHHLACPARPGGEGGGNKMPDPPKKAG